MMLTKGAMRWGGVFVGLSAILHLLALPVSGFHADSIPIFVTGFLDAALAYGLLRGRPWLAFCSNCGGKSSGNSVPVCCTLEDAGGCVDISNFVRRKLVAVSFY